MLFLGIVAGLTILFSFGYVSMDQTIMGASLLLLFCVMVVYCLRRVNENITMLVFLIAFFTFLMGRMVMPLFYDTSNLIFDIGGEAFSVPTLTHMYLCLYLALLFVFLGFVLTHYYWTANDEVSHFSTDSDEVLIIRDMTKQFVYFSLPFLFLTTIEKVLFVFREGYFAMYSDFQSRLPYLINLFSSLFEYALFIFLATLPSKKEAKLPIILYLTIAVVSLGTGQRGSFVLSFLFILMYMFLRNKLTPEDGMWISEKGMLVVAGSIPLLLSFLFLMNYLRTERETDMSTNLLLSFFYQQGVSVEVIGYAKDYEMFFPKDKVYLLGDIVDYFRYNVFTRVLTGSGPLEPQSVKHALEDNSLDACLTYLVKPSFYLEGGGLGGCYIADAWKDLGYVGVALVSFIYGFLLSKIPTWFKSNVWLASVGLIMFNQIVFAPRAHAIKPLSIFTSVAVLLIFLYLYWASRNVSSDTL